MKIFNNFVIFRQRTQYVMYFHIQKFLQVVMILALVDIEIVEAF